MQAFSIEALPQQLYTRTAQKAIQVAVAAFKEVSPLLPPLPSSFLAPQQSVDLFCHRQLSSTSLPYVCLLPAALTMDPYFSHTNSRPVKLLVQAMDLHGLPAALPKDPLQISETMSLVDFDDGDCALLLTASAGSQTLLLPPEVCQAEGKGPHCTGPASTVASLAAKMGLTQILEAQSHSASPAQARADPCQVMLLLASPSRPACDL